MDRLFKFFSSLGLTVVLLAFALLLVFFGTLAQVRLGLYVAQEEYFRSFFVWWQPNGASWKIPVFPGGWMLGTLLLINLVAAHIRRFQLSWKKSGIFLVHAGLIFLLLGQFLTELYQVESVMRLPEGGTKNYSEDSRKNELAVIDVTAPDSDKVVSIPESYLASGKEIKHPELPFIIRPKQYFENSRPAGPMEASNDKLEASHGVGKRLHFEQTRTTATMDDENKPAALIEIVGDKENAGEWVVSTWLSKYPWNEILKEQIGKAFGGELSKPQSFTFAGRTYQIELRPIRYYKDHSITLLESKHDKYQGTEIPKNFSSNIRIDNPKIGETREVLIYMNSPLRYAGETYYQFQMVSEGLKSSTLQVVKNPAWVTPYLACSLMTLGMVVQFLMHLVNFGRRRNAPAPAKVPSGKAVAAAVAASERSGS
jgi:hypothetical protein